MSSTEIPESKELDTGQMMKDAIASSAKVLVGRYGIAAAEYLEGYTGAPTQLGLQDVAKYKVNPEYRYNNLKQQAGFSAEIHFVNKFNAEEIIAHPDNPTRIARSNDVGMGNHPIYDVVIVEPGCLDIVPGEIVGEQVKFCGRFFTSEEQIHSAHQIVEKLMDDTWERYRACDKIRIPSDQYPEAVKYARQRADEYTSQIEHAEKTGNHKLEEQLRNKKDEYSALAERLADAGFDSREGMFLREHPKLATAKYVAQTAHRSGIEYAKSAAIMSSVLFISQNTINVIRGEKNIQEAAVDTAKSVAGSGFFAYITGVTDTIIRSFMSRSKHDVLKSMSSSSLPGVMLNVTTQLAQSIKRYAKKEINSLELASELGERGTGMLAASWGAAVGTLVFPGIGTVLGGMVGHMTSSMIYGSAMKILEEEQLSQDECERITALCQASTEALTIQTAELQASIDMYLKHRRKVIDDCTELLSYAYQQQRFDDFASALNHLACEFGATLEFKNFEEFDAFMNVDSSVLKL